MTAMSAERDIARRRPRVVMVSANAFPVIGGVETHIYEVAPRLSRSGFDVTILTTDRTRKLPAQSEIAGVPVIRVPAWPAKRDYYFAPGVYRAIRSARWDLVHCQGYHTFVPPLAMAAAARNRAPYVVTFHSGGHDSSVRNRLRGVQHLALRPFLVRARKLIAVSDWEASRFAAELHLSRSRFATVPNGAELAGPRPERRAVDGDAGSSEQADGPLVLSIGRIEGTRATSGSWPRWLS
jgi:glycosyltransferase involved in cell wall biosynthesis